jgi:hypothetical protein
MHMRILPASLCLAAIFPLSLFAQEPRPEPPAARAQGMRIVDVTLNRLPDFLQVNGVYIFDGGEDDLVKVLELDGAHGWARVQTKAGESWVNISNVTTITPITKETAAKTEMKAKADFIREGAAAISAAIDDYAAKQNLSMDAPIKWEDIRKLLKSNTALYNANGKDVSGRPYIIGPKVQDYVKVNPDTVKEFMPVIDEPDAYWGKYKP